MPVLNASHPRVDRTIPVRATGHRDFLQILARRRGPRTGEAIIDPRQRVTYGNFWPVVAASRRRSSTSASDNDVLCLASELDRVCLRLLRRSVLGWWRTKIGPISGAGR
jgi:hypothetical protein